MKMMKHILLVMTEQLDDKYAVACAWQMAKKNNATLHIVKIVNNLANLVDLSRPILGRRVDFKQLILNDLEHIISTQLKLKKLPSFVTLKVIEGISFVEIIKQVKRYKSDMLIISADSEQSIDAGFLSSANFHLLRKCPCAVWVVNSAIPLKFKKILVAVDIDPEDKVKTKLNEKLMRTAMQLAEQYRAELHVFYAWQFHGEYFLRNSPFLKIKKSEMDKHVRQQKVLHEKLLTDFIAKYKNKKIKLTPQIYKGLPGEMLSKIIKKQKIDLVVMGTVCRIGMPGFIMGNTAEEILRRIRCSVLTLKPDGFKTSIK